MNKVKERKDVKGRTLALLLNRGNKFTEITEAKDWWQYLGGGANIRVREKGKIWQYNSNVK